MEHGIIQCITAFTACIGFGIVFNLRKGKELFFAAFGGMMGWLIYLLCSPLQNDILQSLIATIVLAVYADVMARVFKSPVTGFVLIALLPMVPGGGIYYTMEYCINGDTARFVESGLHTLGVAGALAIGVLLVSTSSRMWSMIVTRRQERKKRKLESGQ